MPDENLIELLQKSAMALEEEAAYLLDLDIDDEGGSRPAVPAMDIGHFAMLTEQARSIREMIETIRSRRTR